MVFSRQHVLSSELFTPILVRTVGLFESENEQIQVFRADPTGRFRPLERETMGAWRSDPMRNAWGLRIELPMSVDRNLTSLQVTIGTQVFRRDRHEDGPWTVWDSGSHRVLRSTAALAAPRSHIGTVAGAINWGGDAGQWRLAAVYTAGLVALLAIGAASLAGAASMAVRAGRIGYGEARLLVSALVAVAGLTAAPLYLLQRDGQLYFGGTTGLVSDTFGSLLDKTAYGAVYFTQPGADRARVPGTGRDGPRGRAGGGPAPAPPACRSPHGAGHHRPRRDRPRGTARIPGHALADRPHGPVPAAADLDVRRAHGRCARPLRPPGTSHRLRAHGAARVGFGLAHRAGCQRQQRVRLARRCGDARGAGRDRRPCRWQRARERSESASSGCSTPWRVTTRIG